MAFYIAFAFALSGFIQYGHGIRFDDNIYEVVAEGNPPRGFEGPDDIPKAAMDGIIDSQSHSFTSEQLNKDFDNFDIRREAEDHSRRKRRAAFFPLWPKSDDGNVYIPYIVDWNVHSEARHYLQETINEYNRRTCIRIVPRTSETAYVRLIKDKGCWTYMGYVNGERNMSISDEGCFNRGTVIHEFMHILGFYHEHQRMDRDEHINIYYNRIRQSLHEQFDMHAEKRGIVYAEPYDLESVMHYGNRAGANVDTLYTVEAKNDPSRYLGQRDGFSAIDVRQINKRYMCTDFITTIRPYVIGDEEKGSGTEGAEYVGSHKIMNEKYMDEQCRGKCDQTPDIDLVRKVCHCE